MTSFTVSDLCSTKHYETFFLEKLISFLKICETAKETNFVYYLKNGGVTVGFRTTVGVVFTDKGRFTFLYQLKFQGPVYVVNCSWIVSVLIVFCFCPFCRVM